MEEEETVSVSEAEEESNILNKKESTPQLFFPQRASLGALDLLYLGVTIEIMWPRRGHYRAPWPPLSVLVL